MTDTPLRAARRPAGRPGRRAASVAGLAVLALTGAGLVALPGTAHADGGAAPARVIVRTDGPVAVRAAELAVARSGGTVRGRLDLISGFTADVAPAALAALRAVPGVAEVTVNAPVRLHSDTWDPAQDNSMTEISTSAGAELPGVDSLTGAGVGVALIDSGVSRVKGLDQAGQVLRGPDLSFESQAANLRHLDTFGHGTHLAGIIAGRDAPAGSATGGAGFTGVAPGAHLLSLKVATADGATDVSQVLAAIDWVVQHRNDPGFNIRVLNLSFGTDSVQDHRLDPLSFAVEAAWRRGIVVVVAVGNDGAEQTRVAMPAANPYVIAVGAADPNGTESRADDTVADFSARGDAARHADLVAAGRSVVSLRSPGSYVDVNHPSARLSTAPDERFIRGSGTSQAAAVVSGAAALLLQQRPGLTPDQVKRLLTGTAQRLPAADPYAAGAGQLDIARAARTATPQGVTQSHPAATGTGSLELSRGSAHVVDPENGMELVGEQDIFGTAWNPTRWTATSAGARSWSGGTWNGRTWTGGGWSGSGDNRVWSSTTWTGRCWSGLAWSDRTFSDAVWNGQTWTARTWSARTWSARTWSARTWSARTWSARTWSSAMWPDVR